MPVVFLLGVLRELGGQVLRVIALRGDYDGVVLMLTVVLVLRLKEVLCILQEIFRVSQGKLTTVGGCHLGFYLSICESCLLTYFFYDCG